MPNLVFRVLLPEFLSYCKAEHHGVCLLLNAPIDPFELDLYFCVKVNKVCFSCIISYNFNVFPSCTGEPSVQSCFLSYELTVLGGWDIMLQNTEVLMLS